MARVKFKVQPNASKTEFVGALGDALKVKLSSPPLDGKANAELVKYLSKSLGISKSSIKIVSGETSREKILELPGFDRNSVESKIPKRSV